MNTAQSYKSVVLLALIFALSACGASDPATETSQTPAQMDEPTEAEGSANDPEPLVLGPMVPTEEPDNDDQDQGSTTEDEINADPTVGEPGDTNEGATDTPAGQLPAADTPATDTPATDVPGAQTPEPGTPDTETPEPGTPTEETPEQGTPDTETPEPGTPTEGAPGPGTPDTETPEPGTPTEGTPETGPTDEPDTATPAIDINGNEILKPDLTEGSNLQRMVSGLKSQAESVLLELNQKLSQGEGLSRLEENCLGAFEAGFGEPLLAIDCGARGLSNSNLGVTTRIATLYNTAECQAALQEQTTEGCVLQSISLTLSTVWEIPAIGLRPFPVFSGARVDYAVDDTQLLVRNLAQAPTGFFRCNIDLEDSMLNDSNTGANCDTNIESIADRLDEINAPTAD